MPISPKLAGKGSPKMLLESSLSFKIRRYSHDNNLKKIQQTFLTPKANAVPAGKKIS